MPLQSSVAVRILQSRHDPKIYGRIFSVLFEVRLVAAIIVLWSVRQRVLGRLHRRRISHDKCGDHTVSSAIFEAISTVSNSFIMRNTVLFSQNVEGSPRSGPPTPRKGDLRTLNNHRKISKRKKISRNWSAAFDHVCPQVVGITDTSASECQGRGHRGLRNASSSVLTMNVPKEIH